MSEVRNPAQVRLEAGELSLGAGIRHARTAEIARLMATAGYDWLFIDLEHSPISLETAASMAVAALDAGIAPIARVPHMQHDVATRFLDAGGLGIVMPHVDTPEQAREVVAHLRYPPTGHRSVAGQLAQFGFASRPVPQVMQELNRATLVIVMLESPQAIEAAGDIAAVDGVDVLLIGTNDLCAEMGIPGEIGHDRVRAAYETAAGACREHGKHLGMGGVYDPALMREYIAMGAHFLLSGNDLSFLMAAASERAKFLRGLS